MGRPGRPRRHNPCIPGHIDQNALPAGLYWQRDRWVAFEPDPEDGRPRKKTVAWANARLSELHEIMEVRSGKEVRGSLNHLVETFEASLQFQELRPGTQHDYRTHAKVAREYILKDGSTLGAMQVERMNTPLIQRIVDTLAAGREANRPQPALPPRPSKANHVLRYLRRLLTWGIQRGYCRHNPARGVQQAKEKREHQMPRHEVFDALLAFARERCTRPPRSEGSLPPYVAPALVLAYNLRLRGIDMTDLTDAHALDEGIRCDRRKGSLTNITEWNEDLRQAWATLEAYRASRWAAHRRPEPSQASSHFLLVDGRGEPLARNALSLAIGRLKKLAREAGILRPGDKFSLHGLKHLGVTDTPGNRADKRLASGHKTDAMLDVYDHEVPVVKPPSRKRK